MANLFRRYARWLHLQWPAGLVEKHVAIDAKGQTSIPGIYVAGDLTGIPLLKNALQTGCDVVDTIHDLKKNKLPRQEMVDVAIVGAGVSGLAAACRAQEKGLSYQLFERRKVLATLEDFPKEKPIYTYPLDFKPAGCIQVAATTKESLVAELHRQRWEKNIQVIPGHVAKIKQRPNGFHLLDETGQKLSMASTVVIATGKTGQVRRLKVPGEHQPHVYHRLYDPEVFTKTSLVIVGGGDSAVEAAVACAQKGAQVTLVHRGEDLIRPKPVNQERFQAAVSEKKITFLSQSQVKRIETDNVVLLTPTGEKEIKAEAIMVLIGREPPQDFFERSGLSVSGKWRTENWISCAAFLCFCTFLYLWKAGGALTQHFAQAGLFPFNMHFQEGLWTDNAVGQSLNISLKQPGFYYALAYSLLVVYFGYKRIERRKTPYVKWQTLCLMLVQVVPLFLLPYFVLPVLGHSGVFDSGWMRVFADHFFPLVNYDHGREYWRAFGFILAWPLFIWNVMTHEPMWAWLGVSLFQTFVLIPYLVWRYGKGAYCGWICSCGALAETLGDTHREKMPHGPGWNKLNLAGQIILALCFFLLLTRMLAWGFPDTALGQMANVVSLGMLSEWSIGGFPLNYKYLVDLLLAGIVGMGLYFWLSGRVWCRFFCPLAALMNIYGRFSRFRIFAEKSKCISCNQCTAVCHQGIDVMSFAARGAPMQDPQCVRCSACVQTCPTGVLAFGALDGANTPILDRFPASLVKIHQGKSPVPPEGKKPS